ncbi:MAG: hypothetical protein KGH71_03410 [Candidatus Micrarchaeota archaeon]|nr:hypothetical protein [Candidatus Micrarchaeota archaeon]
MERIPLKVDFKYMAQDIRGTEYLLLDLLATRRGYETVELGWGKSSLHKSLAAYTLDQKALISVGEKYVEITGYGEKVYGLIEADKELKRNLVSSALLFLLAEGIPRPQELGTNLNQAVEVIIRN